MNTPFLDEIYDRVDFDRDLVFKYFTIFSLFEYALKKSNYVTGNSGYVEANWDSFVEEIEDFFNPSVSPELKEAVNYLIIFPTKKQTLSNGVLTFVTTNDDNSIIKNLVSTIKRTRNNLFHGGKFSYDYLRDSRLLENSLIILESWAKLNSDVENELKNVR